ncbi:MAG TPA: hypothetical protein VF862_14980 [Gemmatimonadales bacterium]
MTIESRPVRIVTPIGLLLALTGPSVFPIGAAAQQVVDLSRVRNYVDQRVIVEAKVADVLRQRNGEVWMSLGRPYPSGPLVVIVPLNILGAMPDYAAYRGKMVRVTGMVRPGAMEAPPPGTGSGQSLFEGPSRPYIVLEDIGKLERMTPPLET